MIITDYQLPVSAEGLQDGKDAPFFLAFLASKDPSTGRPWCPDVAAALPILENTFKGGDGPRVAFIEVGQRSEWKSPEHFARTKWNVHNTPTLVKFENVGGRVRETERLVEGEILDERRLRGFLNSRS